MKKKILKALFATLVLTATTTTIGFVNTSSSAKAEMKISFPDGTGGVWNSQVYSYLDALGYTGVSIYNIDATGNRYSTSTNHPGYYTITYVFHLRISGHEDVPSGG